MSVDNSNNQLSSQELLRLAEAELMAKKDDSIDWVVMIFLACVVLMSVFSLSAMLYYFPKSIQQNQPQTEEQINVNR